MSLKAFIGWTTDALGASRGRVVWRGENPRPPFGSEREQARRRRQIESGYLTRENGLDVPPRGIPLTDKPIDAQPGFFTRLRDKFAA